MLPRPRAHPSASLQEGKAAKEETGRAPVKRLISKNTLQQKYLNKTILSTYKYYVLMREIYIYIMEIILRYIINKAKNNSVSALSVPLLHTKKEVCVSDFFGFDACP